MKKNLKRVYRKYHIGNVILVSAMQWTRQDAQELGLKLKKPIIYLPCEVDDFKKAINTCSTRELKEIVKYAIRQSEHS